MQSERPGLGMPSPSSTASLTASVGAFAICSSSGVICNTKLVHMQRVDGPGCVVYNTKLVHMQRLDGPGCVVYNTSWCTCKGWMAQGVPSVTQTWHTCKGQMVQGVICNTNLVYMQRLDGPGCHLQHKAGTHATVGRSRVCHLQHKLDTHAMAG